MYAIKIKTMIDRSQRLRIDLPPDTPEGEAEVIVLMLTPELARVDASQASLAPMDTLRAFLKVLDSRPLAQQRSAAEIEVQIAEARASWD